MQYKVDSSPMPPPNMVISHNPIFICILLKMLRYAAQLTGLTQKEGRYAFIAVLVVNVIYDPKLPYSVSDMIKIIEYDK